MDNHQSEQMPARVLFHLIGPNKIQNEMLVSFLADELGVTADESRKINTVLSELTKKDDCHFFIIDCLNADKIDPWALYQLDQLNRIDKYYVFLYNINPETNIEKTAVLNGINGIFYSNQSFKGLPKALNAILEGELWYSRKTLSKYMQMGKNEKGNREENAGSLTSREKEILICIVRGLSNKEMADELCISLHTIKSHIYKIYQKIYVKNRLQASLWAAKYL